MKRRSFALAPGLMAASALAQSKQKSTGGRAASDIFLSNPELSRFHPLRRIIFYDDFNDGINGWAGLEANHNGNLDDLRPVLRDMRPPQLSSCSFFDLGPHGLVENEHRPKRTTIKQAQKAGLTIAMGSRQH